MNSPLFMGIDGGGSTLRIVLVDTKMRPLASARSGATNPSVISQAAARTIIQRGIAEALEKARLRPPDIDAVAIGIAGASNTHSGDWLRQTVEPVLPGCLVVPSSDLEIALVGGLGQRTGILLLAGTGSAVYGSAPKGQRLQIGGWGYLLGDEGSGYWIGRQLLRHVIAQFDAGANVKDEALASDCLESLGLESPREIVSWLYRSEEAPSARIAGLAELVLAASDCSDAAETGGDWARTCIESAADHLARQVNLMRARLNWTEAPVAFAGGLLDNDQLALASVSRLPAGVGSAPGRQARAGLRCRLVGKSLAWELDKRQMTAKDGN